MTRRVITTELLSDLRTTEGQLDVWLLQGSERFASDPAVSEVLIKIARDKDTRRCLLLLGEILNTPGLCRPVVRSAAAGADAQHRDKEAEPVTTGISHGLIFI